MSTVPLKRLVKLAYAQWMFSVVCLVLNVAALLAVCIGNSGTKEIGDFILSIVYFIILFPSWFIIYRTLYKASRKRKPSLFAAFMCLYFLEIIAFCGIAVGVKGTGAAGFLNMISAFKDINTATGIVVLVAAAFWCISAAWSIWIFFLSRIQIKKYHSFYTMLFQYKFCIQFSFLRTKKSKQFSHIFFYPIFFMSYQ